MMGLTKRQRECLDFLRSYHVAHGIVPSHKEISDKLSLGSKSSVVRLLNGLSQRGHIRRSPRKARAIEFINPQNMRAVLLSDEVFRLVQAYAARQKISVDTAASELLREACGGA